MTSGDAVALVGGIALVVSIVWLFWQARRAHHG